MYISFIETFAKRMIISLIHFDWNAKRNFFFHSLAFCLVFAPKEFFALFLSFLFFCLKYSMLNNEKKNTLLLYFFSVIFFSLFLLLDLALIQVRKG